MILNLITERPATYLKFLILVVAHCQGNFGPVAHKSWPVARCTGDRKLQCFLNTKNLGKHKIWSVMTGGRS